MKLLDQRVSTSLELSTNTAKFLVRKTKHPSTVRLRRGPSLNPSQYQIQSNHDFNTFSCFCLYSLRVSTFMNLLANTVPIFVGYLVYGFVRSLCFMNTLISTVFVLYICQCVVFLRRDEIQSIFKYLHISVYQCYQYSFFLHLHIEEDLCTVSSYTLT